MPTIVTFHGTNYAIPAPGEVGWGAQVSSFLIDVANNAVINGATIPSLTITTETVTTAILGESSTTVINGDTLSPAATNIVLTAAAPVSLNSTTAISNGTTDGQMLTLTGTSDTNTVFIQHGANTTMNGDCELGNGEIITFKWDTALKWVETYRSI